MTTIQRLERRTQEGHITLWFDVNSWVPIYAIAAVTQHPSHITIFGNWRIFHDFETMFFK